MTGDLRTRGGRAEIKVSWLHTDDIAGAGHYRAGGLTRG